MTFLIHFLVLKGDRFKPLEFDAREFESIQWFHKNDIPLEKSDPHMARFIEKLNNLSKA